MNSKNVGILIFVILLALVVVFNRGDVTLVSQSDFKLRPISSNGFMLESEIHLNNPNILSCTVKSIHEEFRINGKVIGILDQEINQGIPGRKESSFPVNIRFGKDEYKRPISGDSANSNKANISVEGEIVFSKVIGGGKIVVNENRLLSMDLPKP
jgi:LEA14-like dessication related protein